MFRRETPRIGKRNRLFQQVATPSKLSAGNAADPQRRGFQQQVADAEGVIQRLCGKVGRSFEVALGQGQLSLAQHDPGSELPQFHTLCVLVLHRKDIGGIVNPPGVQISRRKIVGELGSKDRRVLRLAVGNGKGVFKQGDRLVDPLAQQ